MDNNYPCNQCLVQATCAEKCKQRKKIEKIYADLISPLMFTFIAMTYGIVMVYIEFKEYVTNIPAYIWIASICIFWLLMKREGHKPEITMYILAPICLVWFILLKLIQILIINRIKIDEKSL